MMALKNKSIIAALALLSGCLNHSDDLTIQRRSSSGGAAVDAMTITKVEEATDKLTLFFSSSASEPLSNDCTKADDSGASQKPCVCDFQWIEKNDSTGTEVNITRKTTSKVIEVQPYIVRCELPTVYKTEIPDFARIDVRVKPSDSSRFVMEYFQYQKGVNSSTDSDFTSSAGVGFRNIFRYACYEKVEKKLALSSKIFNLSADLSTGTATGKAISATHFCSDKGASGSGCEYARGSAVSQQSYYYNLYVRGSALGSIIEENDRYVCPLVRETLAGGGLGSEQGQVYPLDTSFALAVYPSVNDNLVVPVRAPSVLGRTDQPSTGDNTCTSSDGVVVTDQNGNSNSSSPSSSSISQKCMGFAYKPNAAGSCPTITDANGQIRRTRRLRRFVAEFPPHFENTGLQRAEARATDIIYVLDRPVNRAVDPANPYSIYGPKPCNFAYFDRYGVAGYPRKGNAPTQSVTPYYNHENSVGYRTLGGKAPSYLGTNHSNWNGKNPDAIYFPNYDGWIVPERASCSAALPLVHLDPKGLSPTLVTLASTHWSKVYNNGNASNSATARAPVQVDLFDGGDRIDLDYLYVRPMKPWAPTYVEDKTFEACAPEPEGGIKDPPLHISTDSSGEVAWCAEAYPTQNPYIGDLEQPANIRRDLGIDNYMPGCVKHFTSHGVKGVNGVPTCASTALTLPTGAPAACTLTGAAYGVATPWWRHSGSNLIETGISDAQSCDRTVVISSNNGAWKFFPLLADAQEVEQMLRTDPNYRCAYTSGPSSGTGITPSNGCCNPDLVRTRRQGATDTTAHFEPSSSLGSCGATRE